MHQILALRQYSKDGHVKTTESWFEKGIRATSVDSILLDPHETLKDIDPEERYNTYYTVCQCLEEKGRKFLSQKVVPFDIDGLDLPMGVNNPSHIAEQIARVACGALGVDFEEVGVVFSGNGVQILISTAHEWTDKEYFDVARHHYRALCDKIDLNLATHKLKGKADPSVWSPARLLRHPDTWNRKAGKEERKAKTLQANMIDLEWRLETASGLPDLKPEDHIHPSVAQSYYNNDPDAILNKDYGCDFLKAGFANPDTFSEPWWYAGISITGRFPDGVKWTHDFSKGHPKYSYQETELKRKQAISDKSGPRTCKHIEGIGWKCQTCPQYGKITSPIQIEGPNSIQTLNTGFRFKSKDKDGNEKKGGTPDYPGLWKYFCRTHDYVSVADTPEVYAFKGKYWDGITRDEILSFAHQQLKPAPMDRERREFFSFIKVSNLVKRNFFEDITAGQFNFENGVFDLSDRMLHPHEKKYSFRHVLPCSYEPSADAPNFKKFMEDITCQRPELEKCLQEFMGYAVSGMIPKFDKALLLVGSGENGKSKFIEVVKWLCEGSTSSLSVRDFSDEKKRVALVGKILNVAAENSVKAFMEVQDLKLAISGEELWAKTLYYQPFEFRNRAKIIISVNDLPTNYDHTHGFFRRLLACPFDAVFSRDLGNRDNDILDKLKPELPGIFNYAIEGYERLIQQAGFTIPAEGKAILDEYALDNDSLASWMHDEMEIVVSDNVAESKDDLHMWYVNYCEIAQFKHPYSRPKFFRKMKEFLKRLHVEWKESKFREGESRTRVVYFVRKKIGRPEPARFTGQHAQVWKKD